MKTPILTKKQITQCFDDLMSAQVMYEYSCGDADDHRADLVEKSAKKKIRAYIRYLEQGFDQKTFDFTEQYKYN